MTVLKVEVTVELPLSDDVRVVALHVREGISEHTTAMVELSRPVERKSSKQVLLPRPFVQTRWLCEYCPRSIDAREGQQSE